MTRGPDLRYLLTNHTFGLLWTGQAISTLGDTLYDVAIVWHLLDTTGSALVASGIAVGAIAGRLVGSLFAGIIVDRLHPRRVMLGADLIRLLLTLAMSLLWLLGLVPPLLVLYGLAFALACGSGFFNPARTKAMPQVVSSQHLVHANALDALSTGVVSVFGWTCSGLVVAAAGPTITLLLDAGTFLASYVLVRAAHWQIEDAREVGYVNSATQVLSGARWTKDDSRARTVLAVEALHALAMGFFLAALPLFVKELGGGPILYGVQGGAFWTAVILASAVLSSRSLPRVGLLYAGGMMLNALGNTLAGLAPSACWLLSAVFVAGLGLPAWTAGRQSFLQLHVPPEFRGRVLALLDTLTTAMFVPAWILGGWMADQVGPRTVMIVAPLLHIGLGLSLWLTARVRSFTFPLDA